jgi:hypothetical protein
MSTRLSRRTLRKTAAYQVNPPFDSPGTVFTNGGASGSVTFTLPTPNASLLGTWYRFKALVAQAVVVAAPTADTLIALSDAAADSVQVSTIGGEIEAKCVETSAGVYRWAADGVAVGHTYTVNT